MPWPLLLAPVLLTACQSGSAGPLDPVPAAGVQRQPDERWHHAAVITDGSLTARVVGRWSSQRSQTVRITYHNAGTAPASIKVSDLKMVHRAGEAALRTAVDATGVDMTDAREDNNRPLVLYSLDDPTSRSQTLALAAGTTREVDAELTNFSDTVAAATGDKVTAIIPMATRSFTVTFKLTGAP